MNRNERVRLEAEASTRLANHRISARPSMSWHFAEHDEAGRAKSTYAYAVTWTPGALVLSGDLDEMTLTHWQAMPTWQEAVRWVRGSDFSYLMEKSDKRMEYDPATTLRWLVQEANEAALEGLIGHRIWQQGKQVRDPKWGLRWELQRYRRELSAARAAGLPEDEWPERPCGPEWEIEPLSKERMMEIGCGACRQENEFGLVTVPDLWLPWAKLWHATEAGCRVDLPDICTAWGRRAIKECLKGELEDEHSAAEFLSGLGYDDLPIARDWPAHSVWQIAAFKRWAELVSPETEAIAA